MRIVSILLMLTGLLLILIPRWLFPTCQYAGMMEAGKAAHMICNTTGRVTQGGGVITLLTALLLFFPTGQPVRKGGLALAGVVALALFPLYLLWPGICHSATMPCRAGTWPAVLVTGFLQVGIVVVGLATGVGKGVRVGGRS